MQRVVITGVGAVTPYGCKISTLWSGLESGTPAARAVTDIDGSRNGRVIGAPVAGFSVRDHIDPKSLRLMAPAVAFGVAAAQLAVADSGLNVDGLDPARLGVVVGSRGHSSDRQDLLPAVHQATEGSTFSLAKFGREGLPLVHPMWLLKGLANNVLYFISLKYNAQGMNNNISMGGAAGTMAIGEAFHMVQRGYLDVAITGAYDSGLDLDRVEMFGASELVSRATSAVGASRPFDRRRDGFLPAEGAAFFVLEPLDAASRRGAEIYGEVLGYGASGGAGAPGVHASGPHEKGFARALVAALADAGRARPDAVFAHGLATRTSDVEETRGLRTALGSDAIETPAPALKSMLGNSFAASGAVEALAALLAMRAAALPPTINLDEPDEACDLDYVAGDAARPAALNVVALNNANLAGAHAALILGARP